jgi:hypothetical protein
MTPEIHPRVREVLERAERLFKTNPEIYKPTPNNGIGPSFFFGDDDEERNKLELL